MTRFPNRTFELLAPARNADTGIAAVSCGADAVYIAGPAFGARQAAGNSLGDIARLCEYAHRFGVRIFITVNTIVFEEELPEVAALLHGLQDAGADALIVQDLAVADLCRREGISLPLHASTQCAIRTPEDARFYEGLGFSRLVLERQLSLKEVRSIREAVSCELEFFVHGALCVCYSGNCYLSEALARRSANRGACIQACRSRYDLTDSTGRTLVRNKALLSLRDLNLKDRLEDLADAGICSFKIEGRLKNESYVRNIVRDYSLAMDALGMDRTSWGRVYGGFSPDPDKTFNRGYTSLYIDGQRGHWAAMDAPKSMGEYVGTVRSVSPGGFTLDREKGVVLANGDGFAFATGDDVLGVRGDVCSADTVRCKDTEGLKPGTRIYRNMSAQFEREVSRMTPSRRIGVDVAVEASPGGLMARAVSEDGRVAHAVLETENPVVAEDTARMESIIRDSLSKNTGDYAFSLEGISRFGGHNALPSGQAGEATGQAGTPGDEGGLPLLGAGSINALRRKLAENLDALPCRMKPMMEKEPKKPANTSKIATYKDNAANSLARGYYLDGEDAFELSHRRDAELMRSRYCIRYEMGMCPRHHGSGDNSPLYLRQGTKQLTLRFDCARCEMTVSQV